MWVPESQRWMCKSFSGQACERSNILVRGRGGASGHARDTSVAKHPAIWTRAYRLPNLLVAALILKRPDAGRKYSEHVFQGLGLFLLMAPLTLGGSLLGMPGQVSELWVGGAGSQF